MINVEILIINLVTIYLFNKYHYVLAKKLLLFDYPDFKRKIHLKKTPLTGGVFFLATLIIYQVNSDHSLNRNIYYIIFYLAFFIVGLVDDFLNLKPNSKIIITFTLSLLFISLSSDNQLNNIKLIFFGVDYSYSNFNSIFISAIFLTTLMIVFNLIDGVNGLALTLFLVWIIFLSFFNSELSASQYFLLINIIFYLFLNLKNMSFLGSSGNILLSLFLYIQTLNSYNKNFDFDLIIICLIFYLPYMEAIRLFVLRILNKQSPFTADKNHLHHYLLNSLYWNKNYLIIYLILSCLPLFFSFFNILENITILVLIQIFYLYLIYVFKN